MGTDMQLTQTQSLLGTPAYMSPEQMRSARLVDSRSDIWSLGTVFYEILEGRRPFEAESFSEMCVKVAVDPPAPMVNTPPGLQQAILRCLAKSPEQRYASMADFARDLIPFAQDEHQAHLLVERMQRMISRSQFNWEGTGTGVSGRVQAVRDHGSAPVRATPPPVQWGAGSDPAASPWAGKSEPNAQPWQHGRGSSPLLPDRADASAPYARPMVTEGSGPAVTVNVRAKRRWPLVLGALALLGIGGAVAAVAVSQGDDDAKHAPPPTVQMTTDQPPAPPEPPKQPTVEVKQPEIVKDTEQPEVVKQPEVKQPEVKQAETKPAVKQTKRPAVKASKQPVPKTTTKVEEPKQPETKQPETRSCDPFSAMHGCRDKK
jgi:serine/threonine-protein kinase